MLKLKLTVASRHLAYRCFLIGVSLVSLQAEDNMWVELGPAPSGFTTIARYASLKAKKCPDIKIDGHSTKMAPRLRVGSFDAVVCESILPPMTATASIKGKNLPLPAFKQKKNPVIVVIGDTGCRIKQGSEESAASVGKWTIQNCASAADWPFEEVANSAAAAKPDLVIHVGDYLYREKACLGVPHCPGAPYGDNLDTWEADFFTPGKSLLRAAPWIFVRGNHEDCGRAGDGWFTLLDPRWIGTCERYTEPYLVGTNLGISLVVLDSNPALEVRCDPGDKKCDRMFDEQVATYAKAFKTISGWNLEHAWLLTHRPVWSVKRDKDEGGLLVLNAVEQEAWNRHAPAGIELLLGGHTHVFEAIEFDPQTKRPMQLVVGNSGTQLAPKMKSSPDSVPLKEASISGFEKIQDFGFTTLVPSAAGWSVRARDRTGKVDISCELEGGRAACRNHN
jgi:hypothetical protein